MSASASPPSSNASIPPSRPCRQPPRRKRRRHEPHAAMRGGFRPSGPGWSSPARPSRTPAPATTSCSIAPATWPRRATSSSAMRPNDLPSRDGELMIRPRPEPARAGHVRTARCATWRRSPASNSASGPAAPRPPALTRTGRARSATRSPAAARCHAGRPDRGDADACRRPRAEAAAVIAAAEAHTRRNRRPSGDRARSYDRGWVWKPSRPRAATGPDGAAGGGGGRESRRKARRCGGRKFGRRHHTIARASASCQGKAARRTSGEPGKPRAFPVNSRSPQML